MKSVYDEWSKVCQINDFVEDKSQVKVILV